MHITCPSCSAVNRIPPEREKQHAKCGRCQHELFDGSVTNLTEANFDRFVSKNDLPVIIDFWAAWCGPCQAMAPIFKDVAHQMPFIARFAKVNTEEAHSIAAKYGIRSIPTLVVVKNGKEIDRMAGALPAPQLKQWLQQAVIG